MGKRNHLPDRTNVNGNPPPLSRSNGGRGGKLKTADGRGQKAVVRQACTSPPRGRGPAGPNGSRLEGGCTSVPHPPSAFCRLPSSASPAPRTVTLSVTPGFLATNETGPRKSSLGPAPFFGKSRRLPEPQPGDPGSGVVRTRLRIAFLVAFGIYAFARIRNTEYWDPLDDLNLAVHEAGHLVSQRSARP